MLQQQAVNINADSKEEKTNPQKLKQTKKTQQPKHKPR